MQSSVLRRSSPNERSIAAAYVINEVRYLRLRDRPEQRPTLETLLSEHSGNVSEVAGLMGKERIQIRRWCKMFAIWIDDYRQ